MKPSTKAALKARVREFELQQRSLTVRNAEAYERLEARAAYLEDLLRLYQTEAETLAAEKERAVAASEVDLTREIDQLSDTNYHLSQKLKAMHEELSTVRAEREQDVMEVTKQFHRQLQRNTERVKMSSTALSNENGVLKAKVAQLEAFIREQRALGQAEEEVRIIELQYHVDDLKNELAEKKAEVDVERQQRTTLEDELVSLRQQQHDMISFIDALGDTVERVKDITERGAATNGQLVETLLRSSQALLKEHIQAAEQADLEQQRVQSLRPGGGGNASGGRNNNHPASRNRGGTAAGASADPVQSKLGEATRLLQQRQEAASRVADSAAGTAGDFSGTSGASSGGPRAGSTSNPALALGAAIQKLRASIEAQQIEIALAARVALDAHEATLRETQAKLLNSYAQCEHLVARSAELERQSAETREQCAAERDRALGLRDQAILQLRTRDARDVRPRRHAETQTSAARSSAAVGGENARGTGGGDGGMRSAGAGGGGAFARGGGGGGGGGGNDDGQRSEVSAPSAVPPSASVAAAPAVAAGAGGGSSAATSTAAGAHHHHPPHASGAGGGGGAHGAASRHHHHHPSDGRRHATHN